MTCPPILAGADASLSQTLVALDCQVNGVVEGGYGRLFGAGGAFNGVLTGVLTIYVLLIGYGLITGRLRLSLPAMTPKIACLALVLTFATAWPAYQAVVYGLLTRGPDQIASAFMGARSGAADAFAHRLDHLFDALARTGQAVSAAGDPNAENVKLASKLVWTSAIVTVLSTVGLLVISRIVLAVLLALGPVFVVLALFAPTRGLFEGWLKTSVAFAFAPMLVVLGGSGLVAILEPMSAEILSDPLGAVHDPRGVVGLFVVAMVHAALLPTLAWVAISLTRGWRLGAARSEGARPATIGAGDLRDLGATAAGAAEAGGAPAMTDVRLANLVAAATRDAATAPASLRLSVEAAVGDAGAGSGQPGADRRVAGLGQSFRITPSARAISGRIGA
jgi:type IV secretion system protein VirB6